VATMRPNSQGPTGRSRERRCVSTCGGCERSRLRPLAPALKSEAVPGVKRCLARAGECRAPAGTCREARFLSAKHTEVPGLAVEPPTFGVSVDAGARRDRPFDCIHHEVRNRRDGGKWLDREGMSRSVFLITWHIEATTSSDCFGMTQTGATTWLCSIDSAASRRLGLQGFASCRITSM
jgi:hypothetical protein